MRKINDNPNPKHEVFIREMIKHGNKTRAYLAAYPDSSEASARSASTRLIGNEYIKRRLRAEGRAIETGIYHEKEVFIKNELKVIEGKRAILQQIMAGAGFASNMDRIKAIKADGKMAEQQAALLGYGSLGTVYHVQNIVCNIGGTEAAAEKNAETVTFMNIEPQNDAQHFPPQTATANTLPLFSRYENGAYPVTNANNYSCAGDNDKTIEV